MAMKEWFSESSESEVASDDVMPFEANPEPRAQAVLVLDGSGSMAGQKIQALNNGIREFELQLKADELGRERVEVCVITFGPPKVVVDFVAAKEFNAPSIGAEGGSPMGAAVCQAVAAIQKRRAEYKRFGIDSYKPCVFAISDGEVRDDSFTKAKSLIRELETTETVEDRIAFFIAGVEGANMVSLSELSYRKPLLLDPSKFTEIFRWMGLLMSSISRSQVGEEVETPKIDWMKL